MRVYRWTSAPQSVANRLANARVPFISNQGQLPQDEVRFYARTFAGDDQENRSYSTALCVLTLDIYYRYFTPLLTTE